MEAGECQNDFEVECNDLQMWVGFQNVIQRSWHKIHFLDILLIIGSVEIDMMFWF